ncbi:MAG: Ig-like domain-containing protein, partial [Paludibacteraceae bacterium]|nr:Ig-like domain-containing protein [Paludibacteraceae bacterium]
VAAAGHTGYIYSPSRQIAKKICTDVPVVPTLTNINDKVYLSNAKTTQEYIIFNYSKDASSLTASDWNNAVTPESEVGFFELGGSSNANNTVFTRVKETPSTLVGEQIAEARLYIGTSVYMTDVELSVSKTVGYFQNINNELNCKVGDVIRCDASPVPSNATNWYGVSGSNWTVDFHNTGSQYGTFYEDAECTRPISSSSNYTTVYLKTLQEKNYLDVRILVYNSAIGYKTRYVQFNVTPDGYFPLLDYINGCSRTIAAGEKITGIEVSRRPFSGSVYGLTTEVSGEGTAPIVSFSLYETMTINAINATPGVYVYTPLQNGHPLNNNTTFTITVTDGKYAVDSLILRENAITADPNEELELVAQLMPSNSEAAITWTSSNTSVATVTNGIVTIAANAPIGAKATITATANGKSDECQITVSGEEYDLYVASTRVTSRNRDDILGDGKFAFDGMNTLAIKGNYTISNSANLVRNTGIDGLIIDVAQACTISQGSESYSTLFDLRKNTTIRGKQMTVNGNGVAFGTQKGMILTLDSANLVVNAIMPFKGSGIADDCMNIINSRVEVNASGSAAIFSFTGGISLTDCYIQTPAGGEVVNGAIEDGKGSQVRNLLIVPSPVKVKPALAFASSEATATFNETFVAPVLNNPNGLAVSYYSEDPMVAIVNAETGEVTPVAAGTTTITAYTNGDLFHEEGEVSYTLTVLKGTVSLAFSAPTASVKVDATEFVLPILSNPQDVEVTYSSSNPAVATMFAFTGDVTLVAAGTTTITATFAGDEKYLPNEASYVLTVETAGDPTAIEDVHIESDKAEKVLMDGILYIALPDGKVYNATGEQVK